MHYFVQIFTHSFFPVCIYYLSRQRSISKQGSQCSGHGSIGLGFLEGLDMAGTLNGTLSGMKAIGTGEEEGGEDRRRVGKHPVDGHPPRAMASTVCG